MCRCTWYIVTVVHEKQKFFFPFFFCTWYITSRTTYKLLLLSLVIQLVPLQLPYGNGPVDRENAYHAHELRLLLR